ncbi:hypothetical protein [Paenibacillus ginsengarvi]|uniref:Uncharacterized protein n=1 Tax=Paenibacillus ginsengarvi TaxID=400777 RepID=A0A3B0CM78_9BACL|nr:hypothetical protein [Paenibacillus ginsengarvi]RKN85858.1 hypothetical protein D7M11_05860 [Paenibacillus ginsengarvi]
MKEAIMIDLDGFYLEPVLVSIGAYGITPIYEKPEPPESEEADEAPELPEPILIGYRVAVPVPSGLFKPRYDLTTWKAALSAYDDAMDAYCAALAAYDPDSEDEPSQPPLQVDLRAFWIEGLTRQEIDNIRNAPSPKTDQQEIARLEQQSTISMLAITELFEMMLPIIMPEE